MAECQALKQNKSADFWTRLLYRVVAMHKRGTFSNPQWLALQNLWSNGGHKLSEVLPDTVTAISRAAKEGIQSELIVHEILDLYHKVGLPCIPPL